MIPTECYSESMSYYVYDRLLYVTDCMNKKVSIKWNRRETKNYTVGYEIMYVLTLFRNNSKKLKKGGVTLGYYPVLSGTLSHPAIQEGVCDVQEGQR